VTFSRPLTEGHADPFGGGKAFTFSLTTFSSTIVSLTGLGAAGSKGFVVKALVEDL
jgi:hypothetical protein